MTTKDQAIQLTKENLHSVFGEKDTQKRLQKLSELWVPDSEALFIDPLGAFKSHKAISDMVSRLQESGPGQVFTELSGVDAISHEDADTWVTRLKWGHGPPGKDFEITGLDIVVIVGGKVKALYTFLDEKK